MLSIAYFLFYSLPLAAIRFLYTNLLWSQAPLVAASLLIPLFLSMRSSRLLSYVASIGFLLYYTLIMKSFSVPRGPTGDSGEWWIALSITVMVFFGVRYFSRFLISFLTISFLFCLFFFRNPDRNPPGNIDQKTILSPADGTIVEIVQGEQFLESYPDMAGHFGSKVAIYLSLFDAHVNWLPISGMIEKIQYKPGEFHCAYAPKSSPLNERTDLLIRASKMLPHENEPSSVKYILVRQIAGTIARRIVTWVPVGCEGKRGQTYGMIKFGSRVELFLPCGTTLSVHHNQQVFGNYTTIGQLP